jgi:ribbon-helix-helix protein
VASNNRTWPVGSLGNSRVVTHVLIIYTDKRIYAYMTKDLARDSSRLTITWSKEADHALRTFLGSEGMKKGDLSKFIEEAVRWRIFHQTVREARAAFADVSPDKLQNMIDEAVEDARAKHYRKRAQRH